MWNWNEIRLEGNGIEAWPEVAASPFCGKGYHNG